MLDEEPSESLFDRTVVAVQKYPAESRVAFANAALSELVETYLAEADLARNEAGDDGENVKLIGWARAVDRFADQLLIVMEDVATGFPVELSKTASGSVGLAVAGRMIVLSHPRADQQRAYEQRVLADFCSNKNCAELTKSVDELAPFSLSSVPVSPLWSFTKDGPVCIGSDDEIQVQFRSSENLSLIRGRCVQLLIEVRSLRGEIRWHLRHGVTVNWGKIALQATPEKPEHLVVLNVEGDSALLTLPLLYSSPATLKLIARWMSTRTKGGKPELLQLDAADIAWESVIQ